MTSTQGPKTGLLTESEVLELFASLLASARTQLDDPAVYGSMRLLTIAEKLRDMLKGHVSPDVQQLFDNTEALTTKAQINILDSKTYQETLDELNRIVAKFLISHSSLTGGDHE